MSGRSSAAVQPIESANTGCTAKHDGCRPGAIPVAELLEREAKHGQPLRLHWRKQDLDTQGLARQSDDDDWPTGILPKIPAMRGEAVTADSAGELPQRPRDTVFPEPDETDGPLWFQRDAVVLSQVLNGLRKLA